MGLFIFSVKAYFKAHVDTILLGWCGDNFRKTCFTTVWNILRDRVALLNIDKLSTTWCNQQHIFRRTAKALYCAVEVKSHALPNCIGFIYWTVIVISRPGNIKLQNEIYNRQNRKHELRFQEITLPNGLFLHKYGPLEGLRYDCTLYVRSNVE